MKLVRLPVNPKASRPLILQILFLLLTLLLVFLLVKYNATFFPFLHFGIVLLLLICGISLKIFSGFVRPIRKIRSPSEQFSRVDWYSNDDDLVVRFEKWNNVKSPLIIAIHGWQSDSSSSEYKIQPFIDSGYHVVMIDLPGHGLSDGLKIWTALESGKRILSMLSEEAKGWDQSIIESIVIFGHSIGGFFVLGHADKISKILPIPISRVYLESPMTSWPLVFKQRTKGWKLIPGMLAKADLYWAFKRDGPINNIIWDEFEVPGWGIPSMPVRILQAKYDIALGTHHLNLLRPYAKDDWDIVIDPKLKHFGRGNDRGNADDIYLSWMKE